MNDTLYCNKCGQDRMQVSQGVFACGKCGETTYGYVSEFIPNIWLYQKSKHSRRRWFSKLALEYVDNQYEPALTDDFIQVVQVFESKKLLKGRNISKYGYYLIRLASRKGIKLLKPLKDIKNGKIKDAFNQRLFGVIYPLIKWDDGCKCPYYIKWRKNNGHKKNILHYLVGRV